jgi:hypothetical protein
VQSFGRALCGVLAEPHAELRGSFAESLKQSFVQGFEQSLSVRSFGRALRGASVELYAESWQSFVRSSEGALERASGRASGRASCRAFGRAPYRASDSVLVRAAFN